MTKLISPLQANQLLAGLQKREPKLYDLIRAIIGDLQNITQVTAENSEAINKILNPDEPNSAMTHGQVMKRIAGAT
jgi:hypothetical protein